MDRSDYHNSSSNEDQDDMANYTELPATRPMFSATSFDHYFIQASKPSRTSANVFSTQATPLSSQEHSKAIDASLARVPHVPLVEADYKAAFPHYVSQLHQGFNLVLYGAGSKRRMLNSFAMHVHNTVAGAHVMVINGTRPGLDFKTILSSIEHITKLSSSVHTSPRGIEGQMVHIDNYFSSRISRRELHLIIHNIDAPPFRPRKAIAVLSWLCTNPHIHLTVTADSIAFPIRTFLEGKKTKRRGFAHSQAVNSHRWLWYDVPTFQSYDAELFWADRTSLHGASDAASTSSRTRSDTNASVYSTTIFSAEAARHVLLSVTQKAKKLFALLGTRQTQGVEDFDTSPKKSRNLGIEYGTLFNLARENFIATNDTSLRALMSEFRDHGLMLTSTQPGGMGELVWIPLRKRALEDLVADIEQGRL